MSYRIEQLFESGVNPEGIQTSFRPFPTVEAFESGVNPEGIQTINRDYQLC